MNIEEYNYDLPEKFIAQTPLKDRATSKLLLLNKENGNIKEDVFKNIGFYLKKGDVLVLNDTKVIPARIIGEKIDTKAVIELLLLKDIEGDIWECLAKPAKRLHIGTIISFGDGSLKAEVIEKLDEGIVHVKLIYEGILMEILDKLGTMPLPPYIHEKLEDQSRYQTVYAKNIGSAAAPTAGLHFTKELLENLEKQGVELLYVTLHVGLGTDVAGGFSLSMFRAMADAIQVSKLRWRLMDQTQAPVTLEEAFYMATIGGGSFFGKVGSFEKGYEFDAMILDDSNIRHPQEISTRDRLERLVYLSDDRNLVGKYVQGRKVI